MQFGDVDFAPPRPSAFLPDNDNQLVVTQRLDVEIGHKLRAFEGPAASGKDQIKLPIPELLCERQGVYRIDVKDGRWVLPGKSLDDWLQNSRRYGFRTPNPDLSSGWVGQKLNILDALFQFVERCDAAPFKGHAVDRCTDALRSAIEQPHAKPMLKVGNNFGYGRLRNSELLSSFAHAT